MKLLPPAIFVMGPTAAGKTDLALKLVDNLPCEIISVDSALIYKGMDIGTAKPDAALLRKYPHRLIDIIDPAESYSAARFRSEALAAMEEITAEGRIPLLVGGTMLYFRALQYGLAELPDANPEVRARLDAEMAKKGLAALHERLQAVDPASAARIHPNDPQRIQRALEVYEISGKTMTELHAEADATDFPYNIAKIVVAPDDRKVLHGRIEARFLQMLEQGFVDEVVALKERGDLDLNIPSMRTVGYRQVWEYLDKTYGYDEMLKRAVVATRQLAKRQLTWLRSDREAIWFEADSSALLGNTLQSLKSTLKLES